MNDIAPKDRDIAQYLNRKPKALFGGLNLGGPMRFGAWRAYAGKCRRKNFRDKKVKNLLKNGQIVK